MKRNRFTDEQIVAALRDAEATTVVEAARKHGVAEQTMYRWRQKFAGMEVSDVRELKRLQDENARLKKLLAERDLEVEVMKEIQAKNLCIKTYLLKLDRIEERVKLEMNSKQNPTQIQHLKTNRDRILKKYNTINNKLKTLNYE